MRSLEQNRPAFSGSGGGGVAMRRKGVYR